MKWSLVEIQSLKADLRFPEFANHPNFSGPDEKSSKSTLAWAIGDQIISGFALAGPAQALCFTFSDPKINVDYFFEVNSRISLVQLCFLSQSLLFSSFFDVDYFFSRWGKGQKDSVLSIAPRVSALPTELLEWLHEKDVGPLDLAPLKAISFSAISGFTDAFLKTRPSKSEGVQLLELLVDLILLGTSPATLSMALMSSASVALKNLKVLRYPNSVHRDQDLKEKLKMSWPSNVQAKFQRRGDRAGFDLQVFVSNSVELKKTVIHLEKVIEEWKSLSQNH